MNGDRDYVNTLENLYGKSLILHDTSMWHPVLRFYFIDALAHIDYTLGIMAFNIHSPKNIMTGEYLRWRIDEEKKGERAKFPDFINWLGENHPKSFERLPYLWQKIYRKNDMASYRSFRIVLDPDNREPIRPTVLRQMTEDFFEAEFLKSLYEEGSLARLFGEFSNQG
ncbi:MAG TPA: hypothetical protein VMW63_04090 [Methanoregulaceae archaeon]|nr:hypothetical protein [Methanoregulaceae archaeon]